MHQRGNGRRLHDDRRADDEVHVADSVNVRTPMTRRSSVPAVLGMAAMAVTGRAQQHLAVSTACELTDVIQRIRDRARAADW